MSTFDGSPLFSGYHEVIGTVVVRVSDLIKASQQKEISKAIIDSL